VSQAALGQSDRVIAYAMGLSEPTVRTHLRRALAKLGLGSTIELRAVADLLFDGLRPPASG
jgi:DNA-binding NarL/FixJ family response regulator